MENRIHIQELTTFSSETAKAIRDLAAQLDDKFEELTDHDLQEMLDSPDTHLFLAKDGEKIIGMTTLVIYRIPYKKKAWIEDVVVDASYRGRGIGTIMLQYVISFAKKNGLKAIDLTSNPTREEANKLYIRLGFEKRETSVYRIKI